MAAVNVEQHVFYDARYQALARLLGVDRWSAIGRMAAVWNQCLQTESYVLSEVIVNSMFDDAPVMSEALLKAGLARPHRHGIYICGTKGRIEWLKNKRDAARRNGKLGGRPKETKEEPTDNQHRLQPVTSSTSVPASTSVPIEHKNIREKSKTSLRANSRSHQEWAEDSREMRAARYLFSKVQANNPEAKEPNWQTWAREFDRLFRIDKRPPVAVRALIDWCQADTFWQVNILGPAKLRKQYDALTVKMKKAGTTAPVVREFQRAPEKPE
jgi:hypothetical protein